jgi:class 3 adenylate cyclase/tetratricopeptide (TPR) repeat protein
MEGIEMKCPKCRHKNQDDAKFCNACGHKLDLICSNCGRVNPPSSKFCNECGKELTASAIVFKKELSFDEKINKIQRYLPKGVTEIILSQKGKIEGERKQVTVMFCDLEGFTSLVEHLGPEDAYNMMDQIYEILIHKVHEYEGTVNEMTGDGVLALFGAPIALEDSPQRAIRSAMAIHRELTEFNEKQKELNLPCLKMRIGIHTGPVVVGTLGNDLRVEFKAVGDTVNVASRVEGICKPGTTYVTGDTFNLTTGLFRFESLGEKVIKGKKGPVQLYRVITTSSRRTRFDVNAERGLTPFVGKERELELLLDGLERVKAGRGQAFSIMAEAGVGKSRLLYEFRKAVANENVTFLESRCLSYSCGVAYHPVIDLLKASFDILESDGIFEIRKKVERGLNVLGADEFSILPYILELLAVKESSIDMSSISPDVKKDQIIKALKQIVFTGSKIRPLILAFEDLHWIDKSSEDLLKHLMEDIPGTKILLLFTFRPDFVHTWGARSYHNQITLNRLSNRESLIMVAHLLDAEALNKDLEEFILEKTEGIPFFIEELIKSLKDLKIIEKKEGRYNLTKDLKEVTIPATVQDVIMARVDSLPDKVKGLLQTVSVIGREFSYDLIKCLSMINEQELLSQLSALKDSELLYERGIFPQSTYLFKHALTQEVTYNSLLLKRRNELHEAIGKVIEMLKSDNLEEYCELLAYHYGRSTNIDKAVEYLYMANQKAVKLSAVEEAKVYFDDAMKLLNTVDETEKNQQQRILLLTNQEFVVERLFKFREHYDHLIRYQSMAKRIGIPELLGAYYGRLGHCHFAFGHYNQAIQTLTKAVELCEAAGNNKDVGHAYAYLILSHSDRGDFDRVLTLKENFLSTIEENFNVRLYVRGLSGIQQTYSYLGRWNEAVEEGKKALSTAENFSDNSLVSLAASHLSLTYTGKGDLHRAVEYGELAVQKAPTPGDKARSQRSLGWALCRAGEPKNGIELLMDAVLPLFRDMEFIAFKTPLMCYLGEGYWLAGKKEKAKQTLKECLEMAEQCGARYFVGFAHRVLGEIAIQTNLSQALLHLEKSITIFRKIKAENELALAYADCGRLHKKQAEITLAREYLTEALEIFERLGTLNEPDKVRKELDDFHDV